MKEANFPIIRLKYAWHLDPIVLAANKDPDFIPPPREEVFDRIKQREEIWNTEKNTILTGLYDITGLEFFQNAIDVYFVSQWRGGFSDPLVIGSNVPIEKFNDVLTHELLHRILTDNTLKFDTRKVLTGMFPEVTEKLTFNHIMVHAFHKAILVDVLKDESRFKRDVESSKGKLGYEEAWQIVNEKGYKELISEFKKGY